MLRIGNLITVIFSLCHVGSMQLSTIYPIITQKVSPSASFLSIISTNLKDVSTLNNHPLVQVFSSQFLNEIQNNPAWSLVFNIANIPGIEAGKAFQQLLLPNLQRRGSQKANVIARHCFDISLETFDDIDSKQYQIAFARAYAKYLLKHGYLKHENASKLGKTLAEDIEKTTLTLNLAEQYGYIQVLINAVETFGNRLGLKFTDFVEGAIDILLRELACMKRGICV